jgi:hypothetical protein
MAGLQTDDSLAAATLFGFLAEVLDDMAQRIIRLETHAADMIGSSPRRSELLVVLQDFDLVRQMIEDCARLCTAASRDGDGAAQRNLAGLLHLEALRMRLLQGNSGMAQPMCGAGEGGSGNGSVDFFASG